MGVDGFIKAEGFQVTLRTPGRALVETVELPGADLPAFSKFLRSGFQIIGRANKMKTCWRFRLLTILMQVLMPV